jgi:hypothetical protein
VYLLIPSRNPTPCGRMWGLHAGEIPNWTDYDLVQACCSNLSKCFKSRHLTDTWEHFCTSGRGCCEPLTSGLLNTGAKALPLGVPSVVCALASELLLTHMLISALEPAAASASAATAVVRLAWSNHVPLLNTSACTLAAPSNQATLDTSGRPNLMVYCLFIYKDS